MSKTRGICSIVECGRPHKARGWCSTHLQHWYLYGDPLSRRTLPGVPMTFYWANVDRETDECIIWPFSKSNGGYGRIALGNGKIMYVPHAACERHHGPPPPGRPEAGHLPVVCHDPTCFNGRHLRWISRQQQAIDRELDGTVHRGVDHHAAKLSWVQVSEIRARYAAGGVSHAALAGEYGVAKSAIWMVVNMRAYVPPSA